MDREESFGFCVSTDKWDQIRRPVVDWGTAGIWFEWDQLIWRTMQTDIRFSNHLTGERPLKLDA